MHRYHQRGICCYMPKGISINRNTTFCYQRYMPNGIPDVSAAHSVIQSFTHSLIQNSKFNHPVVQILFTDAFKREHKRELQGDFFQVVKSSRGAAVAGFHVGF